MPEPISYHIDVSPIIEEIGGSVVASDTVEYESLVVGDEAFVATAPVRFDVTVYNSGEALVATGSVALPVVAVCSRCLVEFDLVIEGEVEGAYARSRATAEDEDDFEPIGPDDTIDVGPALLSALVVEAPFAPLHDPDCPGLCSRCGAELSSGGCSCGGDVDVTHPFAGLKDLMEGAPENR